MDIEDRANDVFWHLFRKRHAIPRIPVSRKRRTSQQAGASDDTRRGRQENEAMGSVRSPSLQRTSPRSQTAASPEKKPF
ncbi:MAG: hypothetical protein MZV64_35455 [Ignavibacteriales bacterium]|nr:hypothetical protein [Ignavibacteriales bacterium]